MRAIPHLAFGAFTGAVVASCFQASDPFFADRPIHLAIGAVASGIGSLAPDIDAPGSPISKACFFVAKSIQRRWTHRNAVHSFLGAFAASALVYFALDFLLLFFPIPEHIPGMVCGFFAGGFAGHLVVDTLTINGIKWAWPYKRAFAYPSARRFRVRTGDKKAEWKYTVFFLLLFCAYLPVLQAGGATRSIHKTFQNFQMARADYLDAGGLETVLRFSGTNRHSHAEMNGDGLILDVTSGAFVVLCGDKILTVGDNATIMGTSFLVEYGDDAPHVIERTFVRKPLDAILAQLPNDALVSGALAADQHFQATAPLYAADEFPTISLTANSIRLAYALPADIARLDVRIPDAVRKKQRDVRTMRAKLASLATDLATVTDSLTAEQNLFLRHELRNRIEVLKSKQKALATKLEREQQAMKMADNMTIAFSGKLLLRKLPTGRKHR